MKKKLIAVMLIVFIVVTLILLKKHYDNSYIHLDLKYYITEDIYLYRTSRYMITLKGEYGDSNDNEGIPACIDSVGWNEKYIVILQYNLKKENEHNSYLIPDKTQSNYYIIDIKTKEMIGPISKKEYQEKKIENIKLKKII